VVELARKFEQSPNVMREVVSHMRDGFRDALENVMKAEIELFLTTPEALGRDHGRAGYRRRSSAIVTAGSLPCRRSIFARRRAERSKRRTTAWPERVLIALRHARHEQRLK